MTMRIAGEFQDSALVKVFGQAGVGVFPAPAAISESIIKSFDVEEIGRIDLIRERFYAITIQRRITNPAAAAITKVGRKIFEAK
jgi:LysR family transcriptional activator of nhaA